MLKGEIAEVETIPGRNENPASGEVGNRNSKLHATSCFQQVCGDTDLGEPKKLLVSPCLLGVTRCNKEHPHLKTKNPRGHQRPQGFYPISRQPISSAKRIYLTERSEVYFAKPISRQPISIIKHSPNPHS